ncbi:STXB protein, partial [Amia calva]|nr:STXB protein [Amia calva]
MNKCLFLNCIVGITLWDLKDLQKNAAERSQCKTEFSVSASDSIEDKASALRVNASLKASLLGGMVQVEGAAKYFNDRMKSNSQARVTLQYYTTTKYKQLSMDHLAKENITHKKVFEEDTATHVVTAVLYGAEAYFVFDREVSADENKQEVEGELKLRIDQMKTITMDTQGFVKMNENETTAVNNFNCTFYGDFQLKSNPCTFNDAIQVYSTLPQLLGVNGENAVPVKVWLYPLIKLDSMAAKIVRDISDESATLSQELLEDLQRIEMQCNDLTNHTVAKMFPEVNEKINKLRKMNQQYKIYLMAKLANLLPAIRGGKQHESALREVFNHNEESPFNIQKLNLFLKTKEKEMNKVQGIINKLQNCGLQVLSLESDLDKTVYDKNVKNVVCFTFTSLHQTEPYLAELSDYLKAPGNHRTNRLQHGDQIDCKEWVNNHSFQKMRTCLRLFLELVDLNKGNKETKFFVISKQDEQCPAACILLYESGDGDGDYFEPPAKPASPAGCSVTHDSVTVPMAPPCSATVQRRLQYKAKGQDEWTSHTVMGTEDTVTVSGLQPNTEYELRFTALGKLGYTVSSDISGMKTLPASPPGKPSALQVTPSSITVTWAGPASVGEGATVQGYRVEYIQEEQLDIKEKCVQWLKKTTKRNNSVILKELNKKTSYRIRVFCDCGDPGASAASDEVVITTPETGGCERFQLDPQYYTLLQEGKPSIYKLNLKEESKDERGYCQIYSFGEKAVHLQNRTILVLGATGSGKTTLINGMINHILGVEWEDEFRFKLIHEETNKSQAQSQTSEITAYHIYHREGFKIPYSLTIIDTPGFEDMKGIKQDKLLTKKIRELFSDPNGIVSVDAVCFVVQSFLVRLTPTQKYIFDSILSIFGKDIAENILLFLTFSDGKLCPVLDAVKEAKLPCAKAKDNTPLHFKFNNYVLYLPNTSDCGGAGVEDFEKWLWKMGSYSTHKFLFNLNKMEAKPILLIQKF